MIFNDLLLLIPEKSDPERDAVAEVWQAQGGEVLRLGRFWDLLEINRSRVRLYGNDTFISAFAQANPLPKSCVIDVGYQPLKDWVLVEANATWGAGLNGCDPFGAAKCIAWATVESGTRHR